MRHAARRRWIATVALGFAATSCKARDKVGSADATTRMDGGAAPDASATAEIDATPPDDSIPPTTSDDLNARARHLVEAIAADDPDLAMDIVFPRDGWLATRDADDAGKEWDKVVERPFQHSIHVLARRAEQAQFVSIELGHAVIQETPRHHGWKKPLWTVRGSEVTYVVDGHTRTFRIREMTAWRGAWYVIRIR
jgi:hypothetical protein